MDWLAFAGAHPLLMVVPPAVGIAVLVYKLEERRKARLRAAARELGLVVTDDGLSDVPDGARNLPVFEHGNGHALSCVFWGQNRDYFLAELRYSVGSGKSRTTITQSVAAFHRPGGGIPLFLAAPETFMDKVAALAGGQDVDFEDDAEFSDAVRLRGTDETALRSFFGIAARRFMVGRPQWSVQGNGEWLMGFQFNRRAKPEGLRDFYADAMALRSAFLEG